jgi:hypothetical protein
VRVSAVHGGEGHHRNHHHDKQSAPHPDSFAFTLSRHTSPGTPLMLPIMIFDT